MSAVPLQYERDLDIIEDRLDATERHLKIAENNVEKAGLLLAARKKGRQAYDYIRTGAAAAWGWVRETFHLDPAVEFVSSALSWLRNQLSIISAHFGTSGGAGLGLLALSTSAGRAMLGYALKPVFWVLSKAVTLWTKIENALTVEAEPGQELGLIGKVRNWIADRMASIREFFTGNGTSPGLLQKAAGFFFKNVAPHLEIGSTPMVAARATGFALAGSKMVSGLALIPMGATALAVSQWVLSGMVATAVVTNLWELGKRAWNALSGKSAPAVLHAVPNAHEEQEQADVVAATVVATPAQTQTKATPATVAAAGGNRATRRAQAKAEGNAVPAGK
jgi:hypothetical protein